MPDPTRALTASPPDEHRPSPQTVTAAVTAFVLLLAILWMSPRAIDAILLLLERRRPLQPIERARLALAAPYARLAGMDDADLAGLPPRRRQRVWDLLAREWGIRGMRGHKRKLARKALDWLRDTGQRADTARAGPLDSAARSRALLAWDCSRLVHLARLCFFAGYIDEADAWQYILAGAQKLSTAFHSWDAYGESLLAGRELSAAPPSAELARAVAALLADADSPWRQRSWVAAVGP
jgi:hypothetical protein